jgi:hypothetical protein
MTVLEHNGIMPSVITLNVPFNYYFAECHTYPHVRLTVTLPLSKNYPTLN